MKLFFTILIIAFSMAGCHLKKFSALHIPSTFIGANENKFQTKQGVTYYDGRPFSGWQYLLYENGDTALLIPFLNGKESGVEKKWWPGKQLSEIRIYEKGKKRGEHKSWWENGRLK